MYSAPISGSPNIKSPRMPRKTVGLIVEPACTALELQTGRPVADWNDDPKCTHGEVVAAFDAAIAVLEHAP